MSEGIIYDAMAQNRSAYVIRGMKYITVQVSQLLSVNIRVNKSRSHTIEHNLRRTYATRLIKRIRPILMLNHVQQMASSRKYEIFILQVK